MLWFIGASTVTQVLVFCSLSYYAISAICATVYLYTPELYPTRMRALGTGIASAWLRLASMIAPIITGVVVAGYRLSRAFLPFGMAAVIGGVVTVVLGVETKGRVLEEISP